MTSVGKKIVMAVTGVLLVSFLGVHFLGNLSVYGGAGALNAYADFLHSKPALLWTARLGLIPLFLVHIFFGVWLYLENWKARPVSYVKEKTIQATYSSRTMIWTGLIVLSFLIYHLAHLTLKWIDNPGEKMDSLGRFDEFFYVTMSFKDSIVAGIYVIAVIIFWMHLRHGIASLFQTLGLGHPKYTCVISLIGILAATVIVAGLVSIPLTIWLGVVGGNI